MDIQHLIQSVYQMLLLGASRTQFSPEQLDALAALGIDASLPANELLLQSLVYFRTWEKAGAPFRLFTEPIPAALPETAPVCQSEAIPFLVEVSLGAYPEALPEFLYLLARSGRVLPPEFLPVLIERCVRTPALSALLQPVMGRRGRWLLDQMGKDTLPAPSAPADEASYPEARKALEKIIRDSRLNELHTAEKRVHALRTPPGTYWETEFTLALFSAALEKWEYGVPGAAGFLQNILAVAALSCPAEALPQLQNLPWPKSHYPGFWLGAEIDRFLQTLKFRSRLKEAFRDESP
ncbi:MAG: hypothetical protein IPH16_03020 [Haliscomenobacter sp.]|nr:hypothetical protein [Haliscomenobacter sp.]